MSHQLDNAGISICRRKQKKIVEKVVKNVAQIQLTEINRTWCILIVSQPIPEKEICLAQVLRTYKITLNS